MTHRPDNPPPGSVPPPLDDDPTAAHLREEIAQQRDQLDAVLDELAVRMSPSRLTHEAVAQTRRKLESMPHGKAIGAAAISLGGTLLSYKLGKGILGFAKNHPWITTAAVGAGAWAWWRNQDQEAIIARVQELRDEAQRRIETTRDQTMRRLEAARDQATATADDWQHRATDAVQSARRQGEAALADVKQRGQHALDSAKQQATDVADQARERVDHLTRQARERFSGSEAEEAACRPGDRAAAPAHAAEVQVTRRIDDTRDAAQQVHAATEPAPPSALPEPEPPQKPAGAKADTELSAKPTLPPKQAPQE